MSENRESTRKVVRLRDVAEKAGVSIATVSRLLNNKDLDIRVSEETRKRVFDTAKELNYRPNRLARGLVTAKKNVIGLSFPVFSPPTQTRQRWSLHGVSISSIINGVVAASYAEQKEVLLLQRQEYAKTTAGHSRPLCVDFVDGVIYTAPVPWHDQYTVLIETGIPLVMVGQELSGLDVPYVTLSNENEIFRMTHALLEEGHERIGLLIPQERDTPISQYFLEGYGRALEEAGHEFDGRYVVEGQFGKKAARRLARDLVAVKPAPTTIIVGRNDVAAAILEELKVLGFRCPEDIQLVIFGDEYAFRTTDPPLSAFEANVYELGFEAVKLLEMVMAGEEPESKALYLPFDFIERGSCKLTKGKLPGRTE